MKIRFSKALLFGLVALFATPTALFAQHHHGRAKGHGHFYPFRTPDCRVCVPETTEKKRWVYDYICVRYCVEQCERCRCNGGCTGNNCPSCPKCCVRTKKILIKRLVHDGCETKCTLKNPEEAFIGGPILHGHPGGVIYDGGALPGGGQVIPIPPPGTGSNPKQMPKAKNGQVYSVLPEGTDPAIPTVPEGVPTVTPASAPVVNPSLPVVPAGLPVELQPRH